MVTKTRLPQTLYRNWFYEKELAFKITHGDNYVGDIVMLMFVTIFEILYYAGDRNSMLVTKMAKIVAN